MSLHTPGPFFGSALAGACSAVVLSVPVAAWTARLLGDSYESRVTVYGCFLLWVIAGAVSVFIRTRKVERDGLTAGGILLWFASVWLWPLLLLPVLIHNRLREKK